ncbi:MAG: restriction endonuclease, partial [Acidobacteria bacterium]|nr:restriction endonuclease [Acidobacteriota bacterium]
DQYLLIIDAKDWSRPTDVGDIEKFAGLTKDVRANNGVLICNAGFTKPAHTYAKNLGIGLCNVHDAESRDWSRDLTVPIVWVDLKPQVRTVAKAWFDKGDRVKSDGKFMFILSVDDGEESDELGASFKKVDVLGTFARLWNARRLPCDPDMNHRVRDERPLRALVQDASGAMRWRPVMELALHYTVEQSAWLGQFRPNQCRGLIDYLDGQAFFASYLPFDEVPLQRDDSWTEIESPADVALSIRGTVVASEGIQILDGASGETVDVSLELLKADNQSQREN